MWWNRRRLCVFLRGFGSGGLVGYWQMIYLRHSAFRTMRGGIEVGRGFFIPVEMQLFVLGYQRIVRIFGFKLIGLFFVFVCVLVCIFGLS